MLVPGRIAPWNGQMGEIDAARIIVANGSRNVAFVFAGEEQRHPRYARSWRNQARMHGFDHSAVSWGIARRRSARPTSWS